MRNYHIFSAELFRCFLVVLIQFRCLVFSALLFNTASLFYCCFRVGVCCSFVFFVVGCCLFVVCCLLLLLLVLVWLFVFYKAK